MKKTTCALVMINKYGDILGCHAYGKPQKNGYDFPKGCRDESDEDDLSAAIRELKEETGIILQDKNNVIDAGIHNHNAKKNIHIFIYQVNSFMNLFDLSTLNCTTYFEDRNGKEVPEMDGYKIISKKDREKYFYHGLQNKFELIDKINEK